MTPRRRHATGIPGLSRLHIAILETLIEARDKHAEPGLSPKEIARRSRGMFGKGSSPQLFMALAEMLRRGFIYKLPVSPQKAFYFPGPIGEQVVAAWAFLKRISAAPHGTVVSFAGAREKRINREERP